MSLDILPESASRDKVSIADIYIEPEIEGGYANAWINVEVENHTHEDKEVVAAIIVKLGEALEKIEVIEQIPPEGGVMQAVIRIEEPELWWPHSYGEQTLYTCLVGLQVEGEVQDIGEQRFGLRNLKPFERDGLTVILVNNVDMACDASVWAPPDQFVPNASEARYRKLVKEALDAGAFLIRAWGEGSEIDAAFYNACDEMGLMVWQELAPQTSSSLNDEFADMAAIEISEHVRRLRNHPSVVVWCGSMDLQKINNNKLLHEIIPNVTKELDKSRPYLEQCSFPS